MSCPLYVVTEYVDDDPESTRPLLMSGAEVRDTYPQWGGKAIFTNRDGVVVSVRPAAQLALEAWES